MRQMNRGRNVGGVVVLGDVLVRASVMGSLFNLRMGSPAVPVK